MSMGTNSVHKLFPYRRGGKFGYKVLGVFDNRVTASPLLINWYLKKERMEYKYSNLFSGKAKYSAHYNSNIKVNMSKCAWC